VKMLRIVASTLFSVGIVLLGPPATAVVEPGSPSELDAAAMAGQDVIGTLIADENAETESYAGGSDSQMGTSAMDPWACHGHADPPHTAYSETGKKGVGYDAYQDCAGDFGSQKVCVQLWYLDYYSKGHAISTMSCGPTSVQDHVYRGRFLTCSDIGKGRVPYYTKSKTYAYPDGITFSAGGRSDSAIRCA